MASSYFPMEEDRREKEREKSEKERSSKFGICDGNVEDAELEDESLPTDLSLRDEEQKFEQMEIDYRNSEETWGEKSADKIIKSEERDLSDELGTKQVMKDHQVFATASAAFDEPRDWSDEEKREIGQIGNALAALKLEVEEEEAELEMSASDDKLDAFLDERNVNVIEKEVVAPLGDNLAERTHEEQRLGGFVTAMTFPGAQTVGEDPRTMTQEDRREKQADDEFQALGRKEREQEEQKALAGKDKEEGKENSRNRQKAVDAKSRMLGIGISVAGALVFAVFLGFQLFGGGEKKTEKDPAVDETQEMMKGMRKVAPSDLRGLKERDKQADQQNYDMPGEAKPEPAKEGSEKPTFSPTKGSGAGERRPASGGPSKNFEKDKDIIEQYKDINPAAAAGGAEGGTSLRYRPRPFAAGSGNDTKGGVTYTNQPNIKSGGDTGEFPLHDVQVRARLKFSIRSSASNQITAVSDVDMDGLPAGAIFYGSGSFSNKRTYVQFNKVRSGDREYSIKAYAVSGKDPGIASEVIEIENNAKITFTSGVTDAAGKVLDNLASTATGGATSGIVNGTAGEVKDKNEQERARYEYRVGAGTGFIVYIE